MKIEQCTPSELIAYGNNSRTHSDDQVNQICASITEFGFTNPILIDDDNVIIAGHGRNTAAKQLKLDTVPCIRLSGLTDQQKKAYVIADNQLALNAGWDLDLLKTEIDELLVDEFDINLLGFDDEFLNGLLDVQTSEPLTDEDSVPEVPEEPIAKLGDIWVLGDHRLMCGDSTNINDVEKLMDGNKADLIHTDPPYGMNAVTKSGVLSKNYKTDILGDDDPEVAKDSFRLAISLFPDSKHVWWGANYYSSVLPDSECWLVWDKNNGASDQTDCELAWANFRSVVRQFTKASEKVNRVHPTQKPVELIEWIFKQFKLLSPAVLDLFGGSGSTLIACEKQNYKSFTMEFDPKFVDVIVKRWEQYTGKRAELING